jgi:threonine synthase
LENSLKYISTRSGAPDLEFEDVLLTGLSRDGGLYVPKTWPKFSKKDIRDLRGLNYAEVAAKIIFPFIGNSIPKEVFEEIVTQTYAKFNHNAVAPTKQIGPNQWVAELFHGPTLAFKDYPLQLVGRLFDYFLAKRNQKVTIIGATSGDTGSAAIEACRNRSAIKLFILHPKGRVSEVQRRQMTTVKADNVFNLALNGTFDDCQDMVKALFADEEFRDNYNLSAVNSINWARIMAQIVYYFWTAISLGAPDQKFTYAVPTGNFGNVYAGYAAKKMGLPIEKLIIGSNKNDILTRFFTSGNTKGTMSMAPVISTSSPSMDIQVSSNFERLLFDYYGRDGPAVAKAMEDFRSYKTVDFGNECWQEMRKVFEGYCFNDAEINTAIANLYKETGELLDPHSIIGVLGGQKGHADPTNIMVALATAHPAKFPATVAEAAGIKPQLPTHLADLFEREEKFDVLPNNINRIRNYIVEKLERNDLR